MKLAQVIVSEVPQHTAGTTDTRDTTDTADTIDTAGTTDTEYTRNHRDIKKLYIFRDSYMKEQPN